MDPISERIASLIDEECGGNRSEFARKIKVSPAYVAQIYSGVRVPSDRTLQDICEKFKVQEDWLRHGLEPKRAAVSKEEEIADLVGSALNGSNDFKKAVIRMICSRSDKELETLAQALTAIYENIQKEKS